MPAMRYIVGDPTAYNFLYLATRTFSSENAQLTWANAVDGDPGTAGMFNTAGADLFVKGDLCSNANLDTWSGGLPTGYTDISTGTGDVVEEGTTTVSGKSALITGGASGVGGLRRIYVVRSGTTVKFSIRLRNDTSGTIDVQIRNLDTGYYLSPGAEWQASQVYFVEDDTTGSFSTRTVTFTMQPFSFTNKDAVTLEVRVTKDSDDDGFVDNWLVVPGVNFWSIHGHNATAGNGLAGVAVTYSDDDSSYTGTAGSDPDFNQPSTYQILNATQYRQFWKFTYTGTPTSGTNVYYGELILGQIETASMAPRYGHEVAYNRRQVRNVSRGGNVRVHNSSLFEERVIKMSFGLKGDAELLEMRDQWHRRSDFGRHPMILVPLDTEDIVIHGRVADAVALRRLFMGFREGEVMVAESPFPSIVA
jgi:hypothetical protein